MENNAAHNLEGRTLKSGWVVEEKVKKTANQTGSNFSVGYIVTKSGQNHFLKAFDFAGFLSIALPRSNKDEINVVDVMNDMTSAFIYERDLSEHCKNKHVTKVSVVKASGEEFVEGYSIPIVPYLIFDLAEGDVRQKINFSNDLDYAWRLKSLHDVAVGLKQLHQIEISHQDLKPSNILVFNHDSKIGDLGRSLCLNIDGPYRTKIYSGDWTYAPPEMMYGYFERDWHKRVFATDCYLLGSLIVFYFSGISMSALLRKHIPENFAWEKWRGSFDEIKSYLENGFAAALEEFAANIQKDLLQTDLKLCVEYLCHPFPEKRGHPKSISAPGSNYSMERFITILDRLHSKAEIKVKIRY